MLEQNFSDIYMKFKVHFYQEVFDQINNRETSLSTTEVFCVEVIYALGEPTINEFASFIHVSSPNAAYKVNSLIQKGYVNKVQSKKDKREYHLVLTQKYFDYFNLNQHYISEVVRRIEEHFTPEEIASFDRIIEFTTKELMSEVELPPLDLAKAKGEI